jgi:hypothetical protein
MTNWITPLSFAILAGALPFAFVLRTLLGLPRPLAPSHRRWPLALNSLLVVAVTADVSIFIRNAYYGKRAAEMVFAEFLIAALIYVFALVLMLRQFTGAYHDFIVTTGWTGLGLRKTMLVNMRAVETDSESAGEVRFRIRTARGEQVIFTLPQRYKSIFLERLQKAREEQEGKTPPG